MIRSRLPGLLAALAAVLAFPGMASAHAEFKGSTPAKGEILGAAPTQVAITFTENVQDVAGTYDIQVDRDRGAVVTAGPAVIDDSDRSRMSVPLRPGLAPSRYVVRWKNVSTADGEAKEGAFSFYVKRQPTAVDRANDQQLASIGVEEATPGAAAPTAVAVGPATAPAATSAAPTGFAATRTPEATTSSGSGGSSTVVYVIVGVLAAAAIATAGAWWVFARRT